LDDFEKLLDEHEFNQPVKKDKTFGQFIRINLKLDKKPNSKKVELFK